MPRSERELARHLARALEGAPAASAEARELARLLEAAAAPARVAVASEEVERALAGARPRPPAARRRLPRLALAGVAVVLAAVLAVLLLPLTRAPGLDVQARALVALGGGGTVLHVVERVEPVEPGLFLESVREGYLDLARGRSRWTQTSPYGETIGQTLVEPGRFSRYLADDRTLVTGTSCRSLAGGCAEIVDPVAFYRDALRRARATGERRISFEGRAAYRLAFPLERGGARLTQVVVVDAKTFLPREIRWRERRGRTVALVQLSLVQRLPRARVPAKAFRLSLPRAVHEARIAPAGPPVGSRVLTLAQARRLRPRLLWLGPAYAGHPLAEIRELRWRNGSAFRLDYGPFALWVYSRVLPPQLVGGRLVPAKVFDLDGRPAHLYGTPDGRVALETRLRGRFVTIATFAQAKEPLLRSITALRPLD